jgi:hypothetical protein
MKAELKFSGGMLIAMAVWTVVNVDAMEFVWCLWPIAVCDASL